MGQRWLAGNRAGAKKADLLVEVLSSCIGKLSHDHGPWRGWQAGKRMMITAEPLDLWTRKAVVVDRSHTDYVAAKHGRGIS